ncbi:alkene reductase [Candidatus Odyssella thessalonicensis]|uniref:alkene reductase n=1 Tax=Candidatus Odyssella thessalonicensis TaxID=84647 RepID=UPI000225B4CB|nr:alkene reductase [Candidatus Odyssella thessalonicensis]
MKLLQPITIGDLSLPNRMIMAPLTRCRATEVGRIPNQLMAEYYAQRSTAGLIISEATSVSPMGVGYPNTPGIWSPDQVEGWKTVTEVVHQKGGRIFLQLWHVGRISHPSYLDGQLPVAPSAIAAAGHVSLVRPKTSYPVPRPLVLEEMAQIVEDYRLAAINAQKAGFDGVEIHGANGYLLDQFLQDSSNHRQDIYGGSIENRARLMLEVTDAVISVWGANRVGMHLSPRGDAHSMGDSNKLATFSYVVQQLSDRNIAFICAREHVGEGRIGPQLKALFKGVYIANENLTADTAEELLEKKEADAAAFGRAFIANPDLPRRIANHAPLNEGRPETFYGGTAEGYTDYPFMDD